MNSRFRFSLPVLLLFFGLLPGPLDAQDLKDARDYYSAGVLAMEQDDPYSAVDSFRSAIRLNPAYADARLGMAEALFLLAEFDEAAREIEEARNYAAGRRDLQLLEARIFTALRRYEEAQAIYTGILNRRPHDGAANRGLAEIYALLGQKELAEEAYDLSLRFSPGNRRALLQLVILHDEARERDKADAALQEVLRLFPDSLEVRIQAAEHYALYEQWRSAMDHLSRARSMVSPGDSRYRRVGLLDAELSLMRGDSAAALSILNTLEDQDSPDVLYMMAMAYRDLGDEAMAQRRAALLLRMDPEDEIARMFREESLFLSAGGFAEERREAADWHLDRGRAYEENFFYQRAYNSYRRARLLAKQDPDVWIAYTNLIRKMGFPENYADSLVAALENIPTDRPEYAELQKRLGLLEHSSGNGLAEDWGLESPWTIRKSDWNVGVYVYRDGNSLPLHPRSQDTLGLYFADILDTDPDIRVMPGRSGVGLAVQQVDSFPDAFRNSRGRDDYFALLRFAETERTFSASCEIYISRTGELLARYEELRTGQGRISDTLQILAESVSRDIPEIMRILAIDGSRVLLDKGRWEGLTDEEPWIVVRKDSARPAIVEGGLEYSDDAYLGTVEIAEISEPVSEGLYIRSGDFNFIRVGDQVFHLPEPEAGDRSGGAADPAFRTRLLSIP